MALDLTVVIMTLNEEMHIERCVRSVMAIASRIIVVDSFSTDRTCLIAESLGAEVVQHPFTGFAHQFNWALDHFSIDTAWTLRLDADEYLTPELSGHLTVSLAQYSAQVAGVTFNLRRVFMGRWLCHGMLYPVKLLRLWRTGRGRCESRLMDEHITVDGLVVHAPFDFADHNLNAIGWWSRKHVAYAEREAAQVLLQRRKAPTEAPAAMSAQARRKRWIKESVYLNLPAGLRAFLYFFYRYVLRLGFLDGWPGFVYHVLQAGWYRFLVDVMITEVEELVRQGHPLEQSIADRLGIRLTVDDGGP